MATADTVDSIDTIRGAALDAFYELGYHGTSVREIAKRAHLSVAALYHHFPSKQLILVELVHGLMDDLLEEIRFADTQAPPGPAERLAAVVRAHVLFHIARQAQGFVGNAELRSLNPADRKAIIDKRNQEQRLFDEIIRAGVEAGDFTMAWPVEASRGILTMATAVLSWYEKDAGQTAEEVAELYIELALNMVRYGVVPTSAPT